MDVDIVLDSPRIGHEMPDLSSAQPRDNNGLDAFETASQPQHHDISQNVASAGALSGHTSPHASARASLEAEPPGNGGAECQVRIKDENGQLGGNVGVDERATTAHVESGDAGPANSTCHPVWNGDLFLQVRDILLHALASSRKELESQLKACGIHLDDTDGEALLLKRAQFLLYTCRHATQPTQEQLRNLRLVELLNAVRTTAELSELYRPCTLLLGIGEWMKRAEAVGMKPESFPSDASPAQVSPIVTNGILHGHENGDFISMPSRASLLNMLSPGESADSPVKHAHENANGFTRMQTDSAQDGASGAV